MNLTIVTAQPQDSWWVFLLHGTAAIILGFMFVAAPHATIIAAVTFLGAYWLVAGVLAFVRMFTDRSIPWVYSLLIGFVGILSGILVLRHPLLATIAVPTVLVVVLGVQALITGALDIIGSLKGGGIGSILLGIINILLGLLLLGSPMAAVLATPLLLGMLLLIWGATVVIWAVLVKP